MTPYDPTAIDLSPLADFFANIDRRFALTFSRYMMQEPGADPRKAFDVAQKAIDSRPYVCDVCEDADDCQTHMIDTHGDYQRACSTCRPKLEAAGYAPVAP